MPSKLTVPALLENEGSAGHREKIEPALEIETTSSLSNGNETTPEAAFIALSALETYTAIENVLPTVRDTVEGEKLSVAANVLAGNIKNNPKTKI